MEKGEVNEDNIRHIPDFLLKRNAERQQQAEKRKEEKLELGSAQQQVDIFLESFGKKHTEIKDDLMLIEKGLIDRDNLADRFDKLSKELQILNRYLSTSTVYLRVYDIRKCKQLLEESQTRCQELEEKFLPKKKFGFKVKKHHKPQAKQNINNKVETLDKGGDTVDGELKKTEEWWKDKSEGFYGRHGEVLKMSAELSEGKDIIISDVHECTVLLFGTPNTLQVTGISKCKILSGPVSTSVFVENCKDCTLALACQQLRIHSTSNTHFYIHVTSRAIIEDTTLVKFAPFNWHYKGIEEDLKRAGLDGTRNNWNLIDDFNWLALDTPSPNWSVLDETERTLDWNLSVGDLKIE